MPTSIILYIQNIIFIHSYTAFHVFIGFTISPLQHFR